MEYPDPFIDRMRSLLSQYVKYCEEYEYDSGIRKVVGYNADGTCSVKEVMKKGVDPTFIGFIKYLEIN